MENKFVKVENPAELIPVIEARLPNSCFILNQLKSYASFKDDLEILSYGEINNSNLWVATKFTREDWGVWVSLSGPSEEHKIPAEVKESVLSGKLVDFEKIYLFTSLELHIANMISEMCMDELGLFVTMYPCYLFYMKPEDALQLQIETPAGTQVKELSVEEGTPFISNNWKYCRENTPKIVRKSIERLPSAGIHLVDSNEIICGAITPGFGLISMLHTDPAHRRKGYASIAMRYVIKELARKGLQPCLITERDNKTAVEFQKSLGLTAICKVAFIGNTITKGT